MKNNTTLKSKDTPLIPAFTSLYTLLALRVALFLLFLYCLKAGAFSPALFLLIIILVIELSGFLSRYGLRKLKIETRFNSQRLFPEDEIIYTIRLENEKALPAFLNWSQELPPDVLLIEQEKELTQIIGGAHFRPRAGKDFNYRLTARKRGYYKLPRPKLYARDVLGLFYRQKEVGGSDELIVYPKLLPMESIDIKAADFSGLEQDKRPFLFDPIMFVGLKDYTPDMPIRTIHWKASARQDKLLAKIIEPSASIQILVAIEVDTFIDPPEEELFEKALSLAATLAIWADNNQIPFGLAANIAQVGQEGPIILPVNRNLDQGRVVLESLARAKFVRLGSLEDLLKSESGSLPWGTTLVLLSKGETKIAVPSSLRQIVNYPLEGV